MKKMCLILILGFSAMAAAAPTSASKSRLVRCEGPIMARTMSQGKFPSKNFDQGAVKIAFAMTDTATIKSIQVVTKFKKIKPQSIEAFEAHANKRAIASGKYKADFFNIGNNGACQIGLGYEGDLARSQKATTSWGLLMMGCGNYTVVGNLKCQIK